MSVSALRSDDFRIRSLTARIAGFERRHNITAANRVRCEMHDYLIAKALAALSPERRRRVIRAADELIAEAQQDVDPEANRVQTVVDLRTAGASWTSVGEALGISRQGAWLRYGRPSSPHHVAVEPVRRRRPDPDAAATRRAAALRADGATWDEVGRAFGITRQAAWGRWARLGSPHRLTGQELVS